MDLLNAKIDTSAHTDKGYASHGYPEHESLLMMNEASFSGWIEKNNRDVRDGKGWKEIATKTRKNAKMC